MIWEKFLRQGSDFLIHGKFIGSDTDPWIIQDNIISVNNASPANIANELKNVCDDYHEIKTLDHSRNKEYCCEENSFAFMEELINNLMLN